MFLNDLHYALKCNINMFVYNTTISIVDISVNFRFIIVVSLNENLHKVKHFAEKWLITLNAKKMLLLNISKKQKAHTLNTDAPLPSFLSFTHCPS